MKILLVVITLCVALIPTWIFLIVNAALSPDGFWQQFFVYGAGIWFLGSFQLVALVIWIGLFVEVVID